jgi:hypothetical protein
MQVTASRYWKNFFYAFKFALLIQLLCIVPLLSGCCSKTATVNTEPIDIALLESWSGEYPVSEISRLPGGQQDMAAGYISNTETFNAIWRAFMPKEVLPVIDFSKNIVVFSRNTQFYNRTSILKVTLQGGTAEIIAMETMSALPIEEKVAMAMAVIPRDGVMAIQAGSEKIKVIPSQ